MLLIFWKSSKQTQIFFGIFNFFASYKIIGKLPLKRSACSPGKKKKAKMLIIYTLRTGKLNYSNGNSRFLILLWFSFSISHDFQRRLQYKNIGTQ